MFNLLNLTSFLQKNKVNAGFKKQHYFTSQSLDDYFNNRSPNDKVSERIYYVDGKKFSFEDYNTVPWDKISSPNENIPALINSETGEKFFCNINQQYHRLNGPAIICADGSYTFWLNGVCYYQDIKSWRQSHPNKDCVFHTEMALLYGTGKNDFIF
jgi:hypothetical protein